MGVDRRDYVVVGVDIGSIEKHCISNINSRELEEFVENYYFRTSVGEIVFIDDFYSGKYFIVGEILQSSCDYNEELNYNFFGKDEEIKYAKIRVKAFIKEYFNIDVEPSVIVKTQFS